MIRINLLPWREEARKKKQRQFVTLLVAAIVAMAASIFGWRMMVEGQIEHQKARNDFLKAEIAKVDEKLKEIEELDKTKASILARMQVIQDLQANRPEAVHLMDELVRAVPEGVFLTEMAQSGRTVRLNGMAQSNARVSALMRNAEQSEWLEDPQLQIVQNKGEDKAAGMSEFILTVRQKRQGESDGESGRDEQVVSQ